MKTLICLVLSLFITFNILTIGDTSKGTKIIVLEVKDADYNSLKRKLGPNFKPGGTLTFEEERKTGFGFHSGDLCICF